MASNAISNVNAALEATTHVPIAQLNKDISAPETQHIKAIVTLTWPYSSATSSVAFLLVEPNFRLRKNRGQVRVQFSGSSAKSVQQAGIASGDEVILCLDGVEFVHDVVQASTLGRGVEFELKFTERLLLQFRQEMSQDTNLINIDHPAPEPEVQVRIPSPEIVPTPVTSIYSRVNKDKENGWLSPSSNKRSRSSYGRSSSHQYDPFAERDGYILGRARKRTRLSSSWRFSSRSPSPEIEEEFGQEIVEDLTSPTDTRPPVVLMADEGCQTIDLGIHDEEEAVAQAARQSTNVGTSTRKNGSEDASEAPEGLMMPSPPMQTQFGTPSFRSPQARSTDNISASEPPLSPRLLPVSSDSLSFMSNLVATNPNPFDMGSKEVNSPPRILSSKPPELDTIPSSTQDDIFAASPLGRHVEQPLRDFANVPTSAFEASESNGILGQDKSSLDNSSSHWSSVNTRVALPNSTSSNITPLYELSNGNPDDQTRHESAEEDNGDEHVEANDLQGFSIAQAQSHSPGIVEGEVAEHDFPMSSGQLSHLQYPDLHGEQEHRHDLGTTNLSYPEHAGKVIEGMHQLSRAQSYAVSPSHSPQPAAIDITENDVEEESLGGHHEELFEYESEDGSAADAEVAASANDEPYQGSEEKWYKDEFRGQEDAIRSHYFSGSIVSAAADRDSGEESADEGEDYDEADKIPTDHYSGEEEEFSEEEELGSYDEEDEGAYDDEEEGSYDEEPLEDDEFVTRPPVSTGPVFVDLISDDEDEVVDETTLKVNSGGSHPGSSSNGHEQYDLEDDDDVEEESEEEQEQFDVPEDDEDLEEDALNDSEQFEVEEEDLSNLSDRSEMHGTTTVTETSQSLVQQDLGSLPIANEFTTSIGSIVLDKNSEDSPNVEGTLSSTYDAVVESEDTVYKAKEADPTITENLESNILALAAEEEIRLTSTKETDSEATAKLTDVGVDHDMASDGEALNTNGDYLPKSKFYTGIVQIEEQIETVERVEVDQEPAAIHRVNPEAEEDELGAEEEIAVNTKQSTSTAEHEEENRDSAINKPVDHKFSPERASSEMSSSGLVPPPPMPTSDTFGTDGSNDILTQEHGYAASPSKQIFNDLIEEDVTQLPTPANMQVKEVQFSETSFQASQSISHDQISEDITAEVTSPDTSEQVRASPEVEEKTGKVVINVQEAPRTPNRKASVVASANPETKTWTSPRRSQRIGRSTEPTFESTEVANQISPLGSGKSVEAEGGDYQELSSSMLVDQNTPITGHDASIEMAMSALDSPTKQTYDLRRREPIVDLKLRLFRNLRTQLLDYTALKVLRYHLNKKLDILAIATTSTPDKNHQSASGLGHWHTTFNITDASIAPSGVTEIQISRPYQEALPIVQAGDGILLRNFVVHASKDRGFILRSEKNEACSWAVFKDGQDKAEMRGPPVEYDERENNHIIAMKEWYRSLDAVATAKLGRANATKAALVSKGTGKAS